MLITKRTFLFGVAAAAIVASVPAVARDEEDDELGDLRIRRSFNDPKAAADVAALAKGLKAMRKRKDFLSLENQRAIHANHFNQHGCWRFFPWHRAQLANFEAIIAKLSGKKDFSLPYWDVQEDHVLPPALLDPKSPFYIEGREATATTDYSVERWNFSPEGASIVEENFDTFVGRKDAAGRAEAYGHNSVHVITGGKMADINTAPLDPLFWLHHCNVDRVWATWQYQHYEDPPEEWMAEVIGKFVGPKGPVPDTTAGSLLDMKELGYGYDMGFQGPVFAAPPPRSSEEREPELREAGTDVYEVKAIATGTERGLLLQLPEEALTTLRGKDGEWAMISGSGEVRYSMDNLKRRVITITATGSNKGIAAPRPQVTVGSAPAFFHQMDMKMLGHASHTMPPETYAQIYSFDTAIRNLIRQCDGPIMLSCDTIPLSGPDIATPPKAVAFDLKLTVTRRHWV